ncbi:MAG: META domain-containing protein [Anaerolineae bacterium]
MRYNLITRFKPQLFFIPIALFFIISLLVACKNSEGRLASINDENNIPVHDSDWDSLSIESKPLPPASPMTVRIKPNTIKVSLTPIKYDIPIHGSEWNLISIDGEPLPPTKSMSLGIKPDFIGGNDGCNRFWTKDFSIDEKNQSFQFGGEWSMSLLACISLDKETGETIETVDWGREYTSRLFDDENNYSIDGQSLIFTSSKGELVFLAAVQKPFKDSLWKLDNVTAREGVISSFNIFNIDEEILKEDYLDRPFISGRFPRHEIFKEMYFTVSRTDITGFSGCNEFKGSAGKDLNSFVFVIKKTTDNPCPADELAREDEFLAMFQHIHSLEIREHLLLFYNKEGTRIGLFRTDI